MTIPTPKPTPDPAANPAQSYKDKVLAIYPDALAFNFGVTGAPWMVEEKAFGKLHGETCWDLEQAWKSFYDKFCATPAQSPEVDYYAIAVQLGYSRKNLCGGDVLFEGMYETEIIEIALRRLRENKEALAAFLSGSRYERLD